MLKTLQLYLWGTIILLNIVHISTKELSTAGLDDTILEIFNEEHLESDPCLKDTEEDKDRYPDRNSEGSRSLRKKNPLAIKDEPKCPPPFFQVMFECFYIHVHHHLIWWEARDFCRDMGGDLAEPSSQAALLAVISNNFEGGPHHYWLGASDLKKEGNFTWLSGEPVDGWREGQPDNEGEQDCLELWPSKYPSYGDKNCYHQCAFICQFYP